MSRHKQSVFPPLSQCIQLTEMVLDASIVFSSCIVERTCGALTVCVMLSFLWIDRIQSILPALVFDPDRFLDGRVQKYLTPNPFIFCPFNAGPRICLGQQVISLCSSNTRNSSAFQFAYHEASFFLVRLLQQFTGFTLEKSENVQPPAEWAACDGLKGTDKVYPGAHLTMYVKVSVFFLDFWNPCDVFFCF